MSSCIPLAELAARGANPPIDSRYPSRRVYAGSLAPIPIDNQYFAGSALFLIRRKPMDEAYAHMFEVMDAVLPDEGQLAYLTPSSGSVRSRFPQPWCPHAKSLRVLEPQGRWAFRGAPCSFSSFGAFPVIHVYSLHLVARSCDPPPLHQPPTFRVSPRHPHLDRAHSIGR